MTLWYQSYRKTIQTVVCWIWHQHSDIDNTCCRSASLKICSHITSTVPGKWQDGWEESAKHCALWRLFLWKDLLESGHTKLYDCSMTGMSHIIYFYMHVWFVLPVLCMYYVRGAVIAMHCKHENLLYSRTPPNEQPRPPRLNERPFVPQKCP